LKTFTIGAVLKKRAPKETAQNAFFFVVRPPLF
jgi:hypothetical protein